MYDFTVNIRSRHEYNCKVHGKQQFINLINDDFREDNTVRRFYLDKLHDGCPRDMGWWMVVETNGPRYCQYDINISYPTFVYIAGPTAAIWEPAGIIFHYLFIFKATSSYCNT